MLRRTRGGQPVGSHALFANGCSLLCLLTCTLELLGRLLLDLLVIGR